MRGFIIIKNKVKINTSSLKRWFFSVPAVALALLALIVPRPASANWFTDSLKNFFLEWLGGIVGAVIILVLSLVNQILTFILWAFKEMVDWAVSLSLSVPYTSGNIIDAAWPVTRDLANMGLILVLVAIGIGTILNLKQGEYKKRLGAFFLIALLINFTPVIAGVIIDMSNITARIFYDSAVNSTHALISFGPGDAMGANYGDVVDSLRSMWEGDNNFDATLMRVIKSIIGIFFNVILIFLFILLAALFFARIMFLWLLVILSPLAFLMYILPSTKKHFDRWWRNFLQWSIIVIPLLFFLWIGGLFANNGGQMCVDTIEDSDGITYASGDEGFIAKQDACQMINSLLAAGAIAVGVMISLNSSAEGAKIITSRGNKIFKEQAPKLGKKMLLGAGKGLGKQAYRGAKSRFTEEGREAASRAREARKQLSFTDRAGRYAKKGLQSAVAPVRRKVTDIDEKLGQEWKGIKDYDNWTPDKLVGALGYERDAERRAKIMDIIATKFPYALKEMEENVGTEELKTEVGGRKGLFKGSEWNVYGAMPHISDDIALHVGRASSTDIRKWTKDAWSNPEVMHEALKNNNLSAPVLHDLMKVKDKREAFISGLSEAREKIDPNGLMSLSEILEEIDKKRTNKIGSYLERTPVVAGALKTQSEKSREKRVPEIEAKLEKTEEKIKELKERLSSPIEIPINVRENIQKELSEHQSKKERYEALLYKPQTPKKGTKASSGDTSYIQSEIDRITAELESGDPSDSRRQELSSQLRDLRDQL